MNNILSEFLHLAELFNYWIDEAAILVIIACLAIVYSWRLEAFYSDQEALALHLKKVSERLERLEAFIEEHGLYSAEVNQLYADLKVMKHGFAKVIESKRQDYKGSKLVQLRQTTGNDDEPLRDIVRQESDQGL